jgi:hypothetical protein
MMAFACCFEHVDPRKSVDIVAKNGVLPVTTCGYVVKGTRMLKPKWSRHGSTVSRATFLPVRLLSGLIINSGESGGASTADLAPTGITVWELLRPCRDGRPEPRFPALLLRGQHAGFASLTGGVPRTHHKVRANVLWHIIEAGETPPIISLCPVSGNREALAAHPCHNVNRHTERKPT